MKLIPFLVCIFSALPAARAELPLQRGDSDPPRPGVLSLAEVTRNALEQNPSIKAVRAKWEMMKSRIPQAEAWEDLLVGVDFERKDTTRLGTYSDAEWMVMQKIPIAGKNRSLARAASAEALGTLEELRRQQLDVVAETRAAYFRLVNAQAQLEVNRRNETLLGQFLEISRAKYEVGTQTQANVLIAETELVRVTEDRENLERDFSDAQSQLNVLMNQPARSPLGRPAEFTLKRPAFRPGDLERKALENRPELQFAELRIAAEQQKVEVARRDWIPEPQVRVEARQFKNGSQTVQEYDTGIFFSIPWGNARKYRAQEREARSSVKMATHELEMARTQTLGLVRDALKRVGTLHHHIELFHDRLLPTARQTVEASQTGYESGKTGFLELITAQRSLREFESMYYQHQADYHIALAELEAVVGTELNIFPATKINISRNFK